MRLVFNPETNEVLTENGKRPSISAVMMERIKRKMQGRARGEVWHFTPSLPVMFKPGSRPPSKAAFEVINVVVGGKAHDAADQRRGRDAFLAQNLNALMAMDFANIGIDPKWFNPFPRVKPTEPPKADEKGFHGWRDRAHFKSHLTRKGFVEIGSGYFSTVYHHPKSNRVVKVADGDDSWPHYIMWAAKHGYLGTFAPMVYSLHYIKPRDGSRFYVAVMEKLESTISDAKRNNRWSDAVAAYELVIANRHSFHSLRAIRNRCPKLADFVGELVVDQMRMIGMNWDMHGENFMVRADGSLVITDPFSGRKNPTNDMTRVRSSRFKQFQLAA